MVSVKQPLLLDMGYYAALFAAASIAANLTDMLTTIVSGFLLFKKSVSSSGFSGRRPSVTRQRMRKYERSPAAYLGEKVTMNH